MKLLMLTVVLLCGCSTTALTNISQGARIYDNKGEITDARFIWQRTASGAFEITRPDEYCVGEHSILVDGIDTKSFLASLSILRASSTSALVGQTGTTSTTPTFGVTTTANKVQRGFAIAVCSGEVITCSYSINLFQQLVVGYGTCLSSKNDTRYSLIFK